MILGMGSGWWSLVGLVLDIVGFAILAWDILPEYRLNRAWRYFREASRYATELQKGEIEAPTNVEKAVAKTFRLGDLHHLYEKNLRGLVTANLFLVSDYTDVEATREIEAQRDAPKFDIDLFVKAREPLETGLHAEERKLTERLRPPLRFGIVLVILGFILQAWGSIPV